MTKPSDVIIARNHPRTTATHTHTRHEPHATVYYQS